MDKIEVVGSVYAESACKFRESPRNFIFSRAVIQKTDIENQAVKLLLSIFIQAKALVNARKRL